MVGDLLVESTVAWYDPLKVAEPDGSTAGLLEMYVIEHLVTVSIPLVVVAV
jgi:hypothetical protein